jgi:sugar lactone lactonase YvrE
MATNVQRAALLIDPGCELAEGPHWDHIRKRLTWVDILSGAVYTYSPETEEVHVELFAPPISFAIPRRGGGMILGNRTDLLLIDAASMVRRIKVTEREGVRMNDAKADSAGRLWAGSMSLSSEVANCALYCVSRTLQVRPIVKGVTIANGIGWSPNGDRMYFIDSATHAVDVFGVDAPSGRIGPRERLVAIAERDGIPDGMSIDQEGYVWVALWGGGAVRRYSPSGHLAEVVELPVPKVTSCCFGGADLMDLYITTARRGSNDEIPSTEAHAGALYSIRVDVPGLPSQPFSG